MSAEPLVDVERFSFSKTLRITTLAFKAIFKMRKSREDPGSTVRLHLLQHIQRDCFPNELVYLSSPDCDKLKDVPNLVNNLDLFLDNKGLIRSVGCIAKSLRVSYDIQNSVLLGKGLKLTELLVGFCHYSCNGLQTTLNSVRTDGFWIPKMRQVVKSILSRCIIVTNSILFHFVTLELRIYQSTESIWSNPSNILVLTSLVTFGSKMKKVKL